MAMIQKKTQILSECEEQYNGLNPQSRMLNLAVFRLVWPLMEVRATRITKLLNYGYVNIMYSVQSIRVYNRLDAGKLLDVN